MQRRHQPWIFHQFRIFDCPWHRLGPATSQLPLDKPFLPNSDICSRIVSLYDAAMPAHIASDLLHSWDIICPEYGRYTIFQQRSESPRVRRTDATGRWFDFLFDCGFTFVFRRTCSTFPLWVALHGLLAALAIAGATRGAHLCYYPCGGQQGRKPSRAAPFIA
ncbi:hypothetical protein C8J56DRAFT_963733 [Mycena floridula]|nr:hypothetical protein C8J56DRAFT_963733 [Mycena floridula]